MYCFIKKYCIKLEALLQPVVVILKPFLLWVILFTADCVCFQLRALKAATKHIEDNINRMEVCLFCWQ